MAWDGRRIDNPVLREPWHALAMTLLLLLGAGCSTVGRNAEPQVYAKPQLGTDRFVVVRDYRIHYVEVGEGQPVLLIPGAFTTYRTWNRMLPGLSMHNRVLAIDYVGVGDSDKPERGFRYTVEEQADVVAEMIAALRLPQVTVVGASYGGAVALNLAARYPDLVSRVVCIEGGALITPEALNYSKLGTLLEWPVLGDIIWGFMKSGLFDGTSARSVMGAAWDGLTPAEQEEVIGIFSANIRTASRPSWIRIYRAITDRIDFTEAMDQTSLPVLYLYGEGSRYRAVAEMNVRRFEERNPNIEVMTFQSGIHDLHLQFPHDVTGIVLQFLGTGQAESRIAGALAGPRAGKSVGRDGIMQ